MKSALDILGVTLRSWVGPVPHLDTTQEFCCCFEVSTFWKSVAVTALQKHGRASWNEIQVMDLYTHTLC